MASRRLGLAVVVALCIAGIGSAQANTVGTTERVNVSTGGSQTTGAHSTTPSVSADGRFVAFDSAATNLVTGDTNGFWDVFVRDRQANTTTRVSVDSNGAQGINGNSFNPSISADGRFVVFESGATNLVAGETNGNQDIFVHELESHTTTRVSVDSDGGQAIGGSSHSSISEDGQFVAFQSGATNLVSDDANGFSDIFVRDRDANTTERVSLGPDETEANGGASTGPSISADGQVVAFYSFATTLVADDTNGAYDVFVRDRQANSTERISVDEGGEQVVAGSGNPSVSADGRFVAFHSDAALVAEDTNGLADIFVRDRQANAIERVSVDSDGVQATDGSSFNASISEDGRFVAFESYAASLIDGDTNGASDIFFRDRDTNTTVRVSVRTGGVQSFVGGSFNASISMDGRFVAFDSRAENLVAGDINEYGDVFLHDRFPAIPANNFLIAKPKLNKKKGTAKVQLALPGAGKAELLKSKKVKPSRKLLAGPGKAKLTIKAKGKAAKKLKAKGKVKLKLKFRFTPVGGQAKTITKKVTLKRKR